MSERILVIRHRFIGDTLLMLPMLAALRQARPHAHITVMTAPDAAPLLTYCPWVDERWVFGVTKSEEGIGVNRFWDAVKRARQSRFTAALVLKRSFSSALLPFLAGIPVRIGFATEGRSLLLSQALRYSPMDHESACFRQILEAYLQRPIQLEQLPVTWFGPSDAPQVEAMWQAEVPSAVVCHLGYHISASNSGKQWPHAHFAELARLWLDRQADGCLHIFGTASERHAAEDLVSSLPVGLQQRVVVWAGKLSLRQTALVLSRMAQLVTSDSGLSHLAASVGTPVRVVFGPTDPRKWHPLGQGHTVITTSHPPQCMPCNLKVPCQLAHKCLTDVTPEHVLKVL